MASTARPVAGSQPRVAPQPASVLFIDRTDGAVFRLAYLGLSREFRVIWSDTRARSAAHVQRAHPVCAVVAVNDVGHDDALLLVTWLRSVNVPVIASCVTTEDAAALVAAGAEAALCRPHRVAELVEHVARASQQPRRGSVG
ncbi:MAG: hypothetical protein JNJ54_01675 [Myxococcaceae bacterium]|nr:hypothetical protein [Myxococcaceae bacterium]